MVLSARACVRMETPATSQGHCALSALQWPFLSSNQRNAPSTRRNRASTSPARPDANRERPYANNLGRASALIAACQPAPHASSRLTPGESHHR